MFSILVTTRRSRPRTDVIHHGDERPMTSSIQCQSLMKSVLSYPAIFCIYAVGAASCGLLVNRIFLTSLSQTGGARRPISTIFSIIIFAYRRSGMALDRLVGRKGIVGVHRTSVIVGMASMAMMVIVRLIVITIVITVDRQLVA